MFIKNTTDKIVRIPIYRMHESVIDLYPGQRHEFIITSRASAHHYLGYVFAHKLKFSGLPEGFLGKTLPKEEPVTVAPVKASPEKVETPVKVKAEAPVTKQGTSEVKKG